MPIYVGIHKLPDTSDEELVDKSWSKYKTSCEENGAKAIRLSYNLEKSVAHCITEAPSKEIVEKAHASMEQIPEDVFEIKTIE